MMLRLRLFCRLAMLLGEVLALAVLTEPAGGAETSASTRAAAPVLTRCAEEILRRQAPDGAVVMGTLRTTDNHVLPYFANLAAIGLVQASQDSGQSRYLAAAQRWAEWYAAHRNPDGSIYDFTGAPGAWRSTGNCDSTDAYAGTFLELLEVLREQASAWGSAHYSAVGRAVAAIRLTLQPNGLTTARPGWAVMYTMDNVETSRGLRAAARLATRTGHPEDAAAWQALATRMESGIQTHLWNDKQDVYDVGLQLNGGRMLSKAEWYPDQLANLMAVGWGPASNRHQTLYQKLRSNLSTLPATVKTEADLDHLVWWGFAAQAAGDAARVQQVRAAVGTLDLDKVPVVNTALLGHVCRVLSRGGERQEN